MFTHIHTHTYVRAGSLSSTVGAAAAELLGTAAACAAADADGADGVLAVADACV